jgi:ubiquinone/menaquinone biosynthesis C-methylase UbiE
VNGKPDAAASYWSDEARQESAFSPASYWLAVPEVSARYNARATGEAGIPWYVHCLSFLAEKPVERMLSLGCGFGSLERELWRHNAFRSCDATDVASGAIEAAREQAREQGCEGITYSVADINRIELPHDAYDAAWFNMSLHHVDALEHVCRQVAQSLKPGGRLFVNEYIGPSRFAFPPNQLDAIAAAFALIPPRYRRHCAEPGAPVMAAFTAPDPLEVARVDPSESIRSSDIVAVLETFFTILEYRALGGTLLQFLMNGIAGHFRADDPESMMVLDMLFKIEDTLVDTGTLASDFALIVAKRK